MFIALEVFSCLVPMFDYGLRLYSAAWRLPMTSLWDGFLRFERSQLFAKKVRLLVDSMAFSYSL